MKQLLKKILIKFIRVLVWGIRGNSLVRFKRILSEALNLLHISDEEINLPNSDKLIFHCPNDLTRSRVQSFFEKEPETIEWIDGFNSDDTFWDVGANMGLFSLYAASKGCSVIAFEPSASNYYVLNASIQKSNLSDQISAYCLALSDDNTLDRLMLQYPEFGGALASYGSVVGFDGKDFKPIFEQGMIGYSIDNLIQLFNPPFPNHLKIDVDGIEDRVITGAAKTLADARLKSISIELDAGRPEHTDNIVRAIENGGLRFEKKEHAEMFENSIFSTIYNYHFVRN
jgi:FkbM family methyltransferase